MIKIRELVNTAVMGLVVAGMLSGCWQRDEENPIVDENGTGVVLPSNPNTNLTSEDLNEHYEGSVPFRMTVAGVNLHNIVTNGYEGVETKIDNNAYWIYNDGNFITHENGVPTASILTEVGDSRCHLFLRNEQKDDIHLECTTGAIPVADAPTHVGQSWVWVKDTDVEYLHNYEHGHYDYNVTGKKFETFEADNRQWPKLFVDSNSGSFYGNTEKNDLMYYFVEGPLFEANSTKESMQQDFRAALLGMTNVNYVGDYYTYDTGSRLQMEYRTQITSNMTSRDFFYRIVSMVRSKLGYADVELFPMVKDGAAETTDFLVGFRCTEYGYYKIMIAPYTYFGEGGHFSVQ